MNLIYSKILLISVILFTSLQVIGQSQKEVLPKFENPFPNKSLDTQRTVLKPQNDSPKENEIKVEKRNGSFYFKSVKKKITLSRSVENINSWLGLSDEFTFVEKNNRADELGFSHLSFQPNYKGIPIEGSIVMIHSKNGNISSINGNIIEIEELNTTPKTSKRDAEKLAKEYLKVTELINEYPIETVIYQYRKSDNPKLAFKVRIDSYSPFLMCNVFVDAHSGEVINKVNLIAHADVPGTAETLYSGNHPITCDSHNGSFRLRESGRKIETYNATSATDLNTNGFVGATDFISASTDWGGISQLSSFSINAVAQD